MAGRLGGGRRVQGRDDRRRHVDQRRRLFEGLHVRPDRDDRSLDPVVAAHPVGVLVGRLRVGE